MDVVLQEIKTPRGPLRLIRQLVQLTVSPDCTIERLRAEIADMAPALRFLEGSGPSLRETIQDVSQDPTNADHGAALRLVTCANACLGIPSTVLKAGALKEFLQLNEELSEYGQAIRSGDLDGSEPEFEELLDKQALMLDGLLGRLPATPPI